MLPSTARGTENPQKKIKGCSQHVNFYHHRQPGPYKDLLGCLRRWLFGKGILERGRTFAHMYLKMWLNDIKMESISGAICASLCFCLMIIQSIAQQEPTRVSDEGVRSNPPATLYPWHPHKTLLQFPSDYQTEATKESLFVCDLGIPITQQSSDDTRCHFTSKWANQIPGLVVCDPILPSDNGFSFQGTTVRPVRCLASQNIQPWGWADMTQFLQTFTLSWCYLWQSLIVIAIYLNSAPSTLIV